MAARKSIGPKLRFEVFKRDSFTCQYCGAKAPEAILQADHIEPVADGGETTILNLITSCRACNGGKGATPLGEHHVLNRQLAMLEELEERRQQLEMVLRWRDELQGLSKNAVDMIADRILERTGSAPNESGRADLTRWIKRYTIEDVIAAVDDAFDTYLEYTGNEATNDSWNKAFRKVPLLVSIRRQEAEKPYIRRLLYIQGIIRNRSRARRYNCVDYLEHLHLCGVALDELERRAKAMHDLEDFEAPLDAWLVSIGRPF